MDNVKLGVVFQTAVSISYYDIFTLRKDIFTHTHLRRQTYRFIHTHTHIYVCVCVCVWEREKKREKERLRKRIPTMSSEYNTVSINLSFMTEIKKEK